MDAAHRRVPSLKHNNCLSVFIVHKENIATFLSFLHLTAPLLVSVITFLWCHVLSLTTWDNLFLCFLCIIHFITLMRIIWIRILSVWLIRKLPSTYLWHFRTSVSCYLLAKIKYLPVPMGLSNNLISLDNICYWACSQVKLVLFK